MAPEDLSRADYSHSIMIEPSKLLICHATEAAPRKFTVSFKRQSAEHQHWRGFAGDPAGSDLSRSIDIYRLQEPSWTSSIRARLGQGHDRFPRCAGVHGLLTPRTRRRACRRERPAPRSSAPFCQEPIDTYFAFAVNFFSGVWSGGRAFSTINPASAGHVGG